MICVPIVATTNEAARSDLERAAAVADLAELRLDFLQEKPDLAYLLDKRPCPVIVTNRPSRQGGLWAASEAERVALLRESVLLGAEYVDIEHDAVGRLRERLGTRIIVSYHNFEETPIDLQGIAQTLVGTGGDIIKMSTYVRDAADNIRLCQLAGDLGVPKIIVGMGDRGVTSRILAAKFGSYLTYASLSKGQSSAPGQLTVDQLLNVYHFRSIDASSKIYGVVGTPIGHSLSPHVQNAAFRAAGLNCVYVPFEADQLETFLKCCRCISPEGLSVTIPHKQEAFRLAQETDVITRKIGAVNTLAFREGRIIGTNTDWRAALDAIKSAMPEGETLAGGKALVLGAGGAARAIVFGLVSEGADVTIANRTHERAEDLAGEAGCRAVPWDSRGDVEADVVANSTSLGMYPGVETTPYPKASFRSNCIVFDAVYNPRRTRFLEEAQESGCRVVEGLEMFIHQAAAQFEFWTGLRPPLDVIRRAAVTAFDSMHRDD